MILPTKRISHDRCLSTIGADVLLCLNEERTVSRLWSMTKKRRLIRNPAEVLTFDWFVLALDMLFAIGAITLDDGLVVKSEVRG